MDKKRFKIEFRCVAKEIATISMTTKLICIYPRFGL